MNTVHYWSGKDKAWVDKITQATKYKSKPTPRPGYSSVKFGSSYVIFFSDKDGFENLNKSHINSSAKLVMNPKLVRNTAPKFEDPEKKRKFYSFARDTLKETTGEDLNDSEIDNLLNDSKTGDIIVDMLVKSLDLRRSNKALRTQLSVFETGDTRTLAVAADARFQKELREQESVLRDLRLQADVIKTETRSLSDLRDSIRKEIEEAKNDLHGIKSVEERLARLRNENEIELRKKGNLSSFDRLAEEIARKEVQIQELETRNREGLIRKTDLDSFDKLRTEIVQRESRLQELIQRVQEETVRHSQFQTYEHLNKEVNELESMRRYLNTELESRRSRTTELLTEIESLTIRRDRAYQEAVASGATDIPIPSGSTVAPVIPIQPSGRYGPTIATAPQLPQPTRTQDPWMPSPTPTPTTQIPRPRTPKGGFGDLEID
jgi:hypothetical protein